MQQSASLVAQLASASDCYGEEKAAKFFFFQQIIWRL